MIRNPAFKRIWFLHRETIHREIFSHSVLSFLSILLLTLLLGLFNKTPGMNLVHEDESSLLGVLLELSCTLLSTYFFAFKIFNNLFCPLSAQNKNKEITSSKGHTSASTATSETEQTSINLSNDIESIKKQEPKKQVKILISYIEQNDEQGIGQSVNLQLFFFFIGLLVFGIFCETPT